MAENLLEVQDVAKHFRGPRSLFQRHPNMIRAVDGVSFSIEKGSTFALVGESGCGKTTLAKLILLLEETTEGVLVRVLHHSTELFRRDTGVLPR